MKPFATFLGILTTSLLGLPVMAASNLVQNATLGYIDPSATTTTGTILFGAPLADGNSYQGSPVSPEGYPYTPAGKDGMVISVYQTSIQPLKTVVFYDALWSDGGWFGVNGTGPGASGTLTSSELVVPTLQYTTFIPSAATNYSYDTAVWTTVPTSDFVTNYMSVMTGATVGADGGYSPYGGSYSPPTSVASVFNLDTAIAGVTGVRLVGSAGGSNSWISGYEFAAFSEEVPEPSTYAMLLGGLGVLVVVSRSRRKLSA